jgi:hypothetical protein
MHVGSRLVHLPMLALEPRFFRKSSSFLAEDRSCAFDFVPSRVRSALRRTVHVTPPPHWVGSRAGLHRLSTMRSLPASLLPMVVASKCSHLAMSSPRCGSSCREVIWRWALPFGPSRTSQCDPLLEDHTRDARHPLRKRVSSCDDSHSL